MRMIAQLFKLFVLHYWAMGITTFTKVKKRLSRIGRKEVTELVIAHLKSIFKIDLNPVLGEEVKIPSIQSVLREGKRTNGKFFRKEPEWVDFDNGFVVERKEVDYIIDKLDEYNLQMLLGEPASGKSVILKNIGFKLADNYDVYIVELKKHAIDEVKEFFCEILKCDNRNMVFIVDDAHLCISECERLIRNFRSSELKAKLIIGSRETEEIKGKNPKVCSEFEKLSKTHIYPKDVTENMIECFLRKKHDFGDEKIKKVSRNLGKYKNDLWYLSLALMAYKMDKDSVDDIEIYDKIRDNIRDIRANKDEEPINAEDVFLVLSVFYRFEIPVEKYFLVDELGIDEKIIDQLIGLSEIVESEDVGRSRMLSLNHSSIAELYFKTSKTYPHFGRNVKKKIGDKNKDDLEYCLFYKYLLNTDPRNIIDIVIRLGWRFGEIKEGLALLEKLVKQNEIINAIIKGNDEEENIENIARGIFFITLIGEKVATNIVNNMNIEKIQQKIEREENIQTIGQSIRTIARSSKKVATYIMNNMNIEKIQQKIEKEEDILKIGLCIFNFAVLSKNVAAKIANNMNIEKIQQKIEREENILNIGVCVEGIAQADKMVAVNILNDESIEVIKNKIENEQDIENIAWCIKCIAVSTEYMVTKIFCCKDIELIQQKIDNEQDIRKVEGFVDNATRVNKKLTIEIIDGLKPDKREKIRRYMALWNLL